VAKILTKPVDWEQDFQKLETASAACSELKSQAEAEVKMQDSNVALFKWIMEPGKNPEPSQATMMERTGITNLREDIGHTKSTAGMWFVETNELTSWVNQIRLREVDKPVFWLRGPGRDFPRLLCRIRCSMC